MAAALLAHAAVASATPAPAPRGALLTRTLAGEPTQLYHLYLPEVIGPETPVFVTVHGISRNAREHAEGFAPLAAREGVILVAPLFDAHRFPDYQRLGRAPRGARADHALERIIAEVRRLSGAEARQLYLFGHSGGGQFVHRYAFAYPQRVARYVVSAAGWYTVADPVRAFPYGIRPTRRLPGVSFDAAALLRVPACVLVGERDGRGSRSLRRTARVDSLQGETRVERGEHWVASMRAAAREHGLNTEYAFHVLPRANHRFRRMLKRGDVAAAAFEFLFHGDTTVCREGSD